MWALGGAAVWAPFFKHEDEVSPQLQQTGQLKARHNEGLSSTCALGWQQCCSTRAEMIGAYHSMFLPGPVHLGIDSNSTMLSLNRLVETAACIEASPNMCPRRRALAARPFGKQRLGVTKNGGIWEKLRTVLLARGSVSFKASKVLGHATLADVETCRASLVDKHGNEDADQYADEGVEQHRPGLTCLGNWFEARYQHYQNLVRRVQ